MKKWFLAAVACLFLATSLSGCIPLVVGGAMAGGVLMASDRRTVGAQIDDKTTAQKISYDVTQKYGEKVHVNVSLYNGIALLTGEVPTPEIKSAVEELAKKADHVRGVQNELLVGPNSAVSSRSDDTYITSKVKARFIDSDFSTTHVKVVTERKIVYLMGIVTRREAAEATDIARHTSGVKEVIRIFEYLD